MALDLFLNIELENRKPVVDRQRIRRLDMEEVVFQVEGIRQAVRRIDAHHQRAVVELGKFYAGRRGQARLAHAALAR